MVADLMLGTSPQRPKAKPLKLTAPVVREHPIQIQICKLLTLEIAPAGKVSKAGVVWWSLDAAQYRGNFPANWTARGLIAGMPDTFLLHRGMTYFIEIKAEDGDLSEPQCEVASAIVVAGGRASIARSASEVLIILDEWQIPRARRTRIAA